MVRFGLPPNRFKFKNTHDFSPVDDQSRNRKGSHDRKYALPVVPTSSLLHRYNSFNDAVHPKQQVLCPYD